MAVFPITSTTGDPVFRSQQGSLSSLKRFSRVAADASQKLNSQERIVNPGDDVLSYNVSRRVRSEIGALKTVAETGQLNVTGLGLAIEGLDNIKGALEGVKKALVQAQAASEDERNLIQGQIDLALANIDSTAQNTKLGRRSLLNGDSTVKSYACIGSNGTIADFALFSQGLSVNNTCFITGVKVKQIGNGGPTRTLNDGRSVLSLNVCVVSQGQRACLTLAGGAAGEFTELRITGKLGSSILRLDGDWSGDLTDVAGVASAFNRIAEETGVVLTEASGDLVLASLGYGSDWFVKVEALAESEDATHTVDNGGGAVDMEVGMTLTAFGLNGTALVNGESVRMGGEYGNVVQYSKSGFSIDINLSEGAVVADGGGGSAAAFTINVALSEGVTGILGTSGRSGEKVTYGIGTFTTSTLGAGHSRFLLVQEDGVNSATATESEGQRLLNTNTVADLKSGGTLALATGNTLQALQTVDRAISQVLDEQVRLGSLQSAFVTAVSRAENQIGNLSSADADVIGVDAATEITNLIQAQLGISTASSVLSQANAIQANIFSLLRG